MFFYAKNRGDIGKVLISLKKDDRCFFYRKARNLFNEVDGFK